MRRLAAVAIVFSIAGVARADAGDALPFELAWDAPATCPDVSFVRHRIEQIVRAPPRERTVVVADARIDTVAGGFRLLLTLRTGDVEETKTITAATCSSLAQATATIVALAVETPSSAAGDRGPPAPSGELERGDASAPPPRLEPEPTHEGTGDSRAPSPRTASTAASNARSGEAWRAG